ncbi:MAG: hypothetical protein ACT4O2_00815 [Beijerinckiaceae bacterium]
MRTLDRFLLPARAAISGRWRERSKPLAPDDTAVIASLGAFVALRATKNGESFTFAYPARVI